MQGKPVEIGQYSYCFEPHVAVRTPLLNYSCFGDWLNSDRLLGSSVRAQIDSSNELRRRLSSSQVMEAIQVASPSLHERFKTWDTNCTDARSRKLRHALIRYFSRISYRCTPFGLCAGNSWGPLELAEAGERQRILLDEPATYHRHARLDMGVIALLSDRAAVHGRACAHSRYESNPTLSLQGDRWYFIETKFRDGKPRFELGFVDNSNHLEKLIEFVDAHRAMPTYQELRACLESIDSDVSPAELEKYLEELVRSGVLVNELMPTLTARDGAHSNEDAFARLPLPFADQVRQVQSQLRTLSGLGVGAGSSTIEELTTTIRTLEPKARAGTLLQVDLTKPLRSAKLTDSTFEAVGDIARFALEFPRYPNPELDVFTANFIARYGERQVPLLEALDPDHGVGLDADDSADNDMPEPTQGFLLRRFEEACRTGAQEILISAEDLSELGAGSAAYAPPSLFVLATLIDSKEGIDRSVAVLRWIADSPASRYLARFASYDPRLSDWLRDVSKKEEVATDRDAIHAEIVHWPTGRIGNVLQRPTLRSHEIAIQGRFGVDKSHRVYLRDLLVSAQGSRVELSCRKSGKRVVPWLTTAHNFVAKKQLSIYRFLGALANEHSRLGFRWPRILAEAAELPRVRFRNCIVSPRTWTLREWELDRLKSLPFDDAANAVMRWAHEKRWPQFVELVEYDNRLPFDISSRRSLECLVEELLGVGRATIQEAFTGDLDLVKDSSGGFCNETAFILTRSDVASRNPPSGENITNLHRPYKCAAEHVSIPGGPPWIYAKIYAGPARVDQILASQMQGLRQKLKVEAQSARLFFVRYRDPDFHLRLRVKTDTAEWAKAQKAVHDWLRELSLSKQIWKCELATYEREIERYGGDKMIDAAEEIFFLDSDFVLALAASGECWAEHNRWRWMIKSVESLWRTAALTSGATAGIYKVVAGHLAARLNRGKAGRAAMNLKFRQERMAIFDFLSAKPESSGVHNSRCHEALEARNSGIADFARRFRSLAGAGEPIQPLETIVESLAQSAVARIDRLGNVDAEWVIYETLARLAESERGRNLMSASSMDEETC